MGNFDQTVYRFRAYASHVLDNANPGLAVVIAIAFHNLDGDILGGLSFEFSNVHDNMEEGCPNIRTKSLTNKKLSTTQKNKKKSAHNARKQRG